MMLALPMALLIASEPANAAGQTVAEFETTQQAAWNAHDAGAYTAALAADAEIVTSLGWHWTGQAEAARNLGEGFKFIYARAHLRLADVHVRMLTSELASVILKWSIDGARTITGGTDAGTQDGIETQLLQRHGESWLVITQQDTVATPSPAAAPTSPPASAQSPEQAVPPAATFPTTAPPVRRCVVARANGNCLIYGKPKPPPTR